MNTEKTPTIYGGVTFEQFCDAIETVCKYAGGLANTHTIKDLLTDEHRKNLDSDLLRGSELMMPVNATHSKLIEALKVLHAEVRERIAAKERAAQAELSNTYRPKTENL